MVEAEARAFQLPPVTVDARITLMVRFDVTGNVYEFLVPASRWLDHAARMTGFAVEIHAWVTASNGPAWRWNQRTITIDEWWDKQVGSAERYR